MMHRYTNSSSHRHSELHSHIPGVCSIFIQTVGAAVSNEEVSRWASARPLHTPFGWRARGLGCSRRPLQHPAAPLCGAVPRRRCHVPALPASARSQQGGGAAMMRVGVCVVRGSVRAGVNAAVGRRPLEVAPSAQAVGLRLTLVSTGASARSHFKPFIAVAVAPAGRRAGESVTAGVARIRAVRLLGEKESGNDS